MRRTPIVRLTTELQSQEEHCGRPKYYSITHEIKVQQLLTQLTVGRCGLRTEEADNGRYGDGSDRKIDIEAPTPSNAFREDATQKRTKGRSNAEPNRRTCQQNDNGHIPGSLFERTKSQLDPNKPAVCATAHCVP